MRRAVFCEPCFLSLIPVFHAVWRFGARGGPFRQPSSFLSTRAHQASQKHSDKKLVDRVIVQARAGNGGHGCSSVRKGRTGKVAADGGNGGAGGDVVVRASRDVKSLVGLSRGLVSKGGGHGSSKKQHGRRGSDGVYLVPLGTQVRRFLEQECIRAVPPEGYREEGHAHVEMETNVSNLSNGSVGQIVIDLAEEHEERTVEGGDAEDGGGEGTPTEMIAYELIGDLVHDGDSVIVAKGGAGGRGNVGMGRYRQDHRSDHELGELVRLKLEMKMISDLSLVGFPNVGKSSLLRRLSSAMPRVGSYAFTTMTPQLGSVSVGGGLDRFVVADVPGLIQGAHVDRGVGHTFLKHVERANTIVIVLDAGGAYALDGCKNPLSPEEQLVRLRDELGHFSGELLDKRWMVVLNKMDLVTRRMSFAKKFRAWLADRYGEVPVVSVSALVPETSSVDSIQMLARAMKDMVL